MNEQASGLVHLHVLDQSDYLFFSFISSIPHSLPSPPLSLPSHLYKLCSHYSYNYRTNLMAMFHSRLVIYHNFSHTTSHCETLSQRRLGGEHACPP